MASSSDNPNGSSSDAPKINWNWGGDDMKIDNSMRPPAEKMKGSRAYSVATPAADKSRRAPLKANNPGSIPTAGGKALGAGAREERERRKSQMSDDMKLPSLDKEGSPDPVTENNTQVNTLPQRMNDTEEAPKLEETRSPSAPPPGVTVSDADAPDAPGDAPVNATADAPGDTVGDLPAAKENASPPPAKERRGSRLDDMLGKLKIGGKKNK